MLKTAAKAIPTNYGRYAFRSRLEARWAVFFDALGIPYDYERQGYALRAGWYLPDFWLPRIEAWVEIKGETPTQNEKDKALYLSEVTDRPVYLFHGQILEGATWSYYYGGQVMDEGYLWCECLACGELGIQFSGYSDRLPCAKTGEHLLLPRGRTPATRTPRLRKAYRMATTADFKRRTPHVQELPMEAPYTKLLRLDWLSLEIAIEQYEEDLLEAHGA